MIRQFTATAYIIYDNKTLLVYHRKHQKWLPPGGHVHSNELPHEAAIREAKEETGFDICLIEKNPISIANANACSIPSPYLCLLENIPEKENESAHQHIDLLFLATLKNKRPTCPAQDFHPIQWFSLKELQNMPSHKEIFPETKTIFQKIFSENWILTATSV